MYASTLKYHIENGLKMNPFADDHTLHSGFHPRPSEQQTIMKIENNSIEVHNWMNQNRLKMNTSNTELSLIQYNVLVSLGHTLALQGKWLFKPVTV